MRRCSAAPRGGARPRDSTRGRFEEAPMAADEEDDGVVYRVVVNDEEQYSIWPVDRDLPLGWRAVGVAGRKAECLAHITEVWTDMRPLSLRKKMDAAAPPEH
jgi:MbtH protein